MVWLLGFSCLGGASFACAGLWAWAGVFVLGGGCWGVRGLAGGVMGFTWGWVVFG